MTSEIAVMEVVWHSFPLSGDRFEILRNGEYNATLTGIDKLQLYLRSKGICGEDFDDMVRETNEKKVAAKATHYGKIGFRS